MCACTRKTFIFSKTITCLYKDTTIDDRAKYSTSNIGMTRIIANEDVFQIITGGANFISWIIKLNPFRVIYILFSRTVDYNSNFMLPTLTFSCVKIHCESVWWLTCRVRFSRLLSHFDISSIFIQAKTIGRSLFERIMRFVSRLTRKWNSKCDQKHWNGWVADSRMTESFD